MQLKFLILMIIVAITQYMIKWTHTKVIMMRFGIPIDIVLNFQYC